jgi:hypothetical protein
MVDSVTQRSPPPIVRRTSIATLTGDASWSAMICGHLVLAGHAEVIGNERPRC